MNRLTLRFAATLLPLSLLAAVPANAQVLVPKPDSTEAFMVLAIMATGSEADKARFEKEATALGFKPGRTKNSAGDDEVMVVIMPNAKPEVFFPFYRDARDGKFGKLKFDIALTPWSAVAGKREFLDETRVFRSDAIPMPGE